MSAAATPTGANAPPILHPGTGRHDCSTFASRDGALREAKHLAAVARTLQWADESSEQGDLLDAIAWLGTLEAIGEKLPKVYEIRRETWSAQLTRIQKVDETARPEKRVA